MSNTEGLEAAADAIGKAGDLALACHVGPDGDALGSMLGLGIAAQNAGKTVRASFGSPFVMPPNLAFLPSDLLVPPRRLSTRTGPDGRPRRGFARSSW